MSSIEDQCALLEKEKSSSSFCHLSHIDRETFLELFLSAVVAFYRKIKRSQFDVYNGTRKTVSGTHLEYFVAGRFAYYVSSGSGNQRPVREK